MIPGGSPFMSGVRRILKQIVEINCEAEFPSLWEGLGEGRSYWR
jgi:hypothetical protein